MTIGTAPVFDSKLTLAVSQDVYETLPSLLMSQISDVNEKRGGFDSALIAIIFSFCTVRPLGTVGVLPIYLNKAGPV